MLHISTVDTSNQTVFLGGRVPVVADGYWCCGRQHCNCSIPVPHPIMPSTSSTQPTARPPSHKLDVEPLTLKTRPHSVVDLMSDMLLLWQGWRRAVKEPLPASHTKTQIFSSVLQQFATLCDQERLLMERDDILHTNIGFCSHRRAQSLLWMGYVTPQYRIVNCHGFLTPTGV